MFLQIMLMSMRKTFSSTCLVGLLAGASLLSTSARADVVITQELLPDTSPKIQGDTSQARMAYSPASTLKMIFALTAFKEGAATPETRELCDDKYLPLRPMRLNFQQAMYYSSNAYFRQILADVPLDKVGQMIERCEFGEIKGELPDSLKTMDIYNKVTVTPLQVCAFLRKLAFGQLPVENKYQKDLVKVMSWPSEVEGATVYAKTGAWNRTYWMVGLAVYPTEGQPVFEAIVVMLNKSGSNRDKAIARFWEVVKAGMARHKSKA